MLSFDKPLESVEVAVVQAEPCIACSVCSLDLLFLQLVSPRRLFGPIPPSKIPVPEGLAKIFIIPLVPPRRKCSLYQTICQGPSLPCPRPHAQMAQSGNGELFNHT